MRLNIPKIKEGFFAPIFYNIASVSLLIALGILIYSNTFHSSFHFDDGSAIVHNTSIRNLADIAAIWRYAPTRFMAFLSFAFNYHFNKLNVFWYHVVNLSIHLSSAILVLYFYKLIFSTPALKKERISLRANLIAFFSACIFLCHPIQTESVTYIFQRTTSLAGFFYLFSAVFYLKSRLLAHDNYPASRWVALYIFSWGLCIIGMFTKEHVFTLPLMILLCEFSFFRIDNSFKWRYVLPFLMLLPIIPITLFATKPFTSVDMQRLMSNHYSGFQYFFTQLRVMVTYMRLLFFPLKQNLDYDFPLAKSFWELPILASCFFLLFILFIAIRLFSSPRYKLVAFSVFWFFLVLLPESSIIPLQDIIFEHRLYLPMAGFGLFLVSVTHYFFEHRSSKVMIMILIMIINWYSLLTYTRNFDWINKLTLWEDTVRKSPEKARPLINRGLMYSYQGDFKLAISDFNKALTIFYKEGGMAQENYAGMYNGLTLSEGGFSDACVFFAVKYAEIGKMEDTMLLLKRAIELNPSNAQAYINLAAAYGDLRDYKKAILMGNKALELNANSSMAHYNLSVAYYFEHKYALAVKHCEMARKLGYQVPPDFLELLSPHRK